jgi:thymidylate kinase
MKEAAPNSENCGGKVMGNAPAYMRNQLLLPSQAKEVTIPKERPQLPQTVNGQTQPVQEQQLSTVEQVALSSRVLIIEGISGSGKDTLQSYLKDVLRNRIVYDYSEGEVLHSWKQFQIEGILELRIKFMKLFVNYMREIVNGDKDAVFLLNRFHLSTYAWTIIQQQKLGAEYDEIINVLRTLPVHVFVLQLDENEIEERSSHPERSSAWQKFQQHIIKNYSFRDRLERQQKIILQTARIQQIPYSVIKLPPYEPHNSDEHTPIARGSSIVQTTHQAVSARGKKRRPPQSPRANH